MRDWAKNNPKIHRHTGGLEKTSISLKHLRLIHRHTGGLENYQ
ncbi:hypothetical protein [uncultured Gammaproteobacteria bacterium]|nr:hypothetical protein [uncultured Gammaproteobacteria bacterium]CAC9632718.1 hypothetical protein [uncultured Gammaproteobacteria bacterium]CAC9634040.1 hypothetical protein [uncultured Gammaproteobacteria bacterium]CAC9656524.1 hypothetical protein [uncultured Gammaproteobacteria bacterium]